MGKIILYHGSPNEEIVPTYGLGEERHDYGKGFYLTENVELAKEWAVCNPITQKGWVHKYEFDTSEMSILDFSEKGVLVWLAELMSHRAADDTKRYRELSKKFIEKYSIATESYDVIKGWRADASFFYIAKAFVRDEVDMEILEELFMLGDLGIQYCIKTEKAYANLHEMKDGLIAVDMGEYRHKYNERDVAARIRMKELINSDKNNLNVVFSKLVSAE